MTNYQRSDISCFLRAGGGIIAALAVLLGAGSNAAWADPAGTSAPCTVTGTHPVRQSTPIFDQVTGGRPIAELTGSSVRMELAELPQDPTGRAKIVAVDGTPGVRITGYVAAEEVAVYAAKDIPIATGHVWIASGHRVQATRGASAAAMSAAREIAGSRAQTVRASISCDALTLDRIVPTRLELPRTARAYTMKKSSIMLYDKPRGAPVFTLELLDGSAQVFWTTERSKRGYVHVRSRDDVAIDAWAKASDLKALSRREAKDLLDQPSSEATTLVEVQISLNPVPPIKKVTKDVVVRSQRDAKAAVIGSVAAGTEVYVFETTGGWISILPRGVRMRPPAGGGFWVPGDALPN